MTIPAKPNKLGEISRVLTSALAASGGEGNPLSLSPQRMVCVVLVDGLGHYNLEKRRGHAPVLSSLPRTKSYTVFPSTTAAAITSLATGLHPSAHGILAHVAHDPEFGATKNLLSGWESQSEALRWKARADLSESLDDGRKLFNVSASEYRDTGFTALTMSHTQFAAADSMQDRFITARQLMRDKRNRGVIYLYVQELDQAGHRHGWQSDQWSRLLEDLDALMNQLLDDLPADCGVLLTADHGQLDSPVESRHELKQLLPNQLLAFAGDSRAAYLYLKAGQDASSVRAELTKSEVPALVVETQELIDAGWFGGEFSAQARRRLPQLVMLAQGDSTLFHSDFSKSRSYLMTGHHGGLTDQELAIPLIRVGF